MGHGLFALALVVGCEHGARDEDGDGYVAADDCDDGDASVHPNASEVCDHADNDCDGTTDVEAIGAVAYYADSDSDGYGSGEATFACTPPAGMAATRGDCDDTTDAAHPGLEEVCADGVDNDCDGIDPECACAAVEDEYPELKGIADCDAIDVEFGMALTDTSGNVLPAEVEPGVQWTVAAEIRNLTNQDLTVRSADCVVKYLGFYFDDEWVRGIFNCGPTEVEVPASGVWTSGPYELFPMFTEGGEQFGGLLIYWYLDDADVGHTCWVCSDDIPAR